MDEDGPFRAPPRLHAAGHSFRNSARLLEHAGKRVHPRGHRPRVDASSAADLRSQHVRRLGESHTVARVRHIELERAGAMVCGASAVARRTFITDKIWSSTSPASSCTTSRTEHQEPRPRDAVSPSATRWSMSLTEARGHREASERTPPVHGIDSVLIGSIREVRRHAVPTAEPLDGIRPPHPPGFPEWPSRMKVPGRVPSPLPPRR